MRLLHARHDHDRRRFSSIAGVTTSAIMSSAKNWKAICAAAPVYQNIVQSIAAGAKAMANSDLA